MIEGCDVKLYIIKALTRGFEDWGIDFDDFYVTYELDIGFKEIEYPAELFTFTVVSPKRLNKIINDGDVEIGRGYFIMTDFNENSIKKTVERLIKKCQTDDYEETNINLSKYFKWEMDT